LAGYASYALGFLSGQGDARLSKADGSKSSP
jgi:hypothetical protein